MRTRENVTGEAANYNCEFVSCFESLALSNASSLSPWPCYLFPQFLVDVVVVFLCFPLVHLQDIDKGCCAQNLRRKFQAVCVALTFCGKLSPEQDWINSDLNPLVTAANIYIITLNTCNLYITASTVLSYECMYNIYSNLAPNLSNRFKKWPKSWSRKSRRLSSRREKKCSVYVDLLTRTFVGDSFNQKQVYSWFWEVAFEWYPEIQDY